MEIKYLNQKINIKIDRPMGSTHPQHGFIYPLNYGYVPGTISGDNEELDAYLLGVYEPVETYYGKVIAIIHREDDDDDKLVVVPPGMVFSDEQIIALTAFQERFFKSQIIRENEVTQYINAFPLEVQTKLITLRNLILGLSDKIEEKIAWGVPTYYYHGYLVQIAGNKKHLGFYTSLAALTYFKDELTGFKTNEKNTLQIGLDQSIPKELIEKMMLFRMLENLSKSVNK